jgi:hypothetical protein
MRADTSPVSILVNSKTKQSRTVVTRVLVPYVFSSFHLGNVRATSILERRTTYALITIIGTLFLLFCTNCFLWKWFFFQHFLLLCTITLRRLLSSYYPRSIQRWVSSNLRVRLPHRHLAYYILVKSQTNQTRTLIPKQFKHLWAYQTLFN